MTPVVAVLAPDKHVRLRRSKGSSANGQTPPSRWGTPAVASTLAVHGCAAPAASGVNERAAVRSNTAHAPAHFTPALIDRCPSGPLSFTPSFPFLCLLFSRTCVRSPPRIRVHGTALPSTSWKHQHGQPRIAKSRCLCKSAMADEKRRFTL